MHENVFVYMGKMSVLHSKLGKRWRSKQFKQQRSKKKVNSYDPVLTLNQLYSASLNFLQ